MVVGWPYRRAVAEGPVLEEGERVLPPVMQPLPVEAVDTILGLHLMAGPHGKSIVISPRDSTAGRLTHSRP